MRKGYVNLGRRGWGKREVMLGRLIRDEEGHGDVGAGANNGDNGTGNSAPGANSESGTNNNGQGFDAASFWGSQNQGAEGSGNPGSATEGESGSGTGGGENFAEQMTNQLSSMSFGGPVLTAEIAQQINEGNFEGFQTALNSSLQTAVRQTMAMNVQILRPLVDQILQQVDGKINGAFGNRDNSTALETEFPAARDPKIRPMVQRVFDQALANTKGNRGDAVKQTKEMLSILTQSMGGDLGLNVAPRGAGDSGRSSDPSINWLDELTGRN